MPDDEGARDALVTAGNRDGEYVIREERLDGTLG